MGDERKTYRKLAAIVFTDIFGFTAIMSKDERKALALLRKNRKVLKPLIQQFNGEWLKEMGDGTLSSFPSAVEAVNCALGIQRSLQDDPELKLRIGIHIGDVIFAERDVFGDGVNIASRIEPLAAPGGICITERVFEEIRNKPGFETVFLGEKSLKNVGRPIKVYAIAGGNLPTPSIIGTSDKQASVEKPVSTLISHYKIIEKIGEGGMGVVYKAEDIMLKRPVALKFLRPEAMKNAEQKQRIFKEAQAAASMDHSNICTIYEIAELEGQTFIAMAFIDGQSLEKKINEGPLPIDEALDIAIQVAQGLDKAHSHGIVHRDIKSANILMTGDGKAKIVDFGIAKLGDTPQLTREGATLGTIAYMSPEQARGEFIDHRTDLWSLGVVLYEMLTGTLPFGRESGVTTIYSILNAEPHSITEIRSNMPASLDRIMRRALAKNLAQRYQNAGEMFADISALKTESIPCGSPQIQPVPDELNAPHELIDPQIPSTVINCHVFFDASLSMKGFVQAGISSNYAQTVKDLEHTLIRAWSDYQALYYQFGAIINTITRDEFRNAINTKFYESPAVNKDTNIYSIFETPKYFNAENLTLVITDLFEHGSDIYLLAQKIKKVIFERGLSLGVLGIRSQYDGMIDNITEKGYTTRYQTKGTSTYRPFYILMAGAYGNILKCYEKLKEGFLKDVPEELSRFVIFTKDVLFPPISYTDSQILSMSQIALSAQVKFNIRQLVKVNKFVGRRKPFINSRYRLNYLPHVLHSYFENMIIKIKARNLKQGSFYNDPQISQIIKPTMLRNDESSFDLKIEVDWEMLQESLPYFCIVDIQPMINYATFPNWFIEWDMDDRNLEANWRGSEKVGSKTYNLLPFLKTISEIFTPTTQQIYFILKQ